MVPSWRSYLKVLGDVAWIKCVIGGFKRLGPFIQPFLISNSQGLKSKWVWQGFLILITQGWNEDIGSGQPAIACRRWGQYVHSVHSIFMSYSYCQLIESSPLYVYVWDSLSLSDWWSMYSLCSWVQPVFSLWLPSLYNGINSPWKAMVQMSLMFTSLYKSEKSYFLRTHKISLGLHR